MLDAGERKGGGEEMIAKIIKHITSKGDRKNE